MNDVVTKAWSDRTTHEYKGLKGLAKENLCDNMTNAELVLNMLAELSTTEISKQHEPETFTENAEIARVGGFPVCKSRGVASARPEQPRL